MREKRYKIVSGTVDEVEAQVNQLINEQIEYEGELWKWFTHGELIPLSNGKVAQVMHFSQKW